MPDDTGVLEATAKVLVIEDDEVLRQLLIDVLSDQGYVVEAAETGEDGLKLMEADVFDIVLLDINLPGMDGMDVLRLAPARQPDAQVVMMTAFGTVDTAVEAMKQGAFDYINKPFSTDELLLTITRALEEQDLRREVARLRQKARGIGGDIQIVGKSPAIERVLDLIARVSSESST
jgi:DNA-binding NtrC family response regulator